MASRIILPFWPTATNNVSWSADSLIAVGGGDFLAILMPRLRNCGPNESPWEQILLQINGFTASEVAPADVLSWANFSLGEELSLRNIIGLSWSSPGLAKFGACALAVLHSHHVLTLWACEGRSEVKDKWQRCLIINHAVQEFYDQTDPIVDDADVERLEERQVRQRIRAFAWSQPVRNRHGFSDDLKGFLDRGQQILAVSTEAQDILLLHIRSPYSDTSSESSEWKVQVVHQFDCCAHVFNAAQMLPGGMELANQINDEGGDAMLADELTWSGWDEGGRAQLAYTINGRLFVSQMEADTSSPGSIKIEPTGEDAHLLPSQSDVSGPISFEPGSNRLTVFAPDQILKIRVPSNADDAPDMHDLDGRWDEISGLAYTYDEEGGSNLHITSFMSTLSVQTRCLDVDLKPTSSRPAWPRAMAKTSSSYSAEADLEGNVEERIYGIASSPMGDLVATCSMMLPSDVPSHIIQSEQYCYLNITQEWSPAGTSILPVGCGRVFATDISAETLLLSLQQHLEQEELDTMDRDLMVQSMVQAIAVPNLDWSTIASNIPRDSSNPEQIIAWLRLRMYLSPVAFKERLARLADIAMRQQPKLHLSIEAYHDFFQVIESLPHSLSENDKISKDIVNTSSAARNKVNSHTGASSEAVVTPVEVCQICQKDIPFESLRWSRCTTGHQFTRCSLSLLTIHTPGTSKFCRICNAQYLNEDAVLEVTGEDDIATKDLQDDQANGSTENGVQVTQNQSAAGMSLARLLFSACDWCILCGGRFFV